MKQQFIKASDEWISEEEKKERNGIAGAQFINGIIGLSQHNGVFEEALAGKLGGFSLLDEAKRRVVEDMSKDGAEKVLSTISDSMGGKLSSSSNAISKIDDSLDAVKDLLADIPEFHEDKTALEEALSMHSELDVSLSHSSPQYDPDELLSNISESLGVDIENPDDVREFYNGAPVTSSSSSHRTQTVEEVRDRYYSVGYSTEKPSEPASGLSLFDGDQELDSLTGYDVATFNGGKLLLRTNDGKEAEIDLRPKGSPPSTRSPSNKKDEILANKDDLEDELKFEVWACVLLDVVGYVYDEWKKTKKVLEDMLSLVDLVRIIKEQKQSLHNAFRVEVRKGLSDIKRSVSEILPPEINSGISYLSNQSTFKLPSVSSGGSIACDFNKSHYCSIHNNLKFYIDNLEASINAKIGEIIDLADIDITPLLDAVSVPYAEIRDQMDKIDKWVGKIKKEVCAYIQRRMSGVPRSVSRIQNAIASILLAITTASGVLDSFSFGQSDEIPRVSKMLRKAGYDRAAKTLSEGKIGEFLNMDYLESTAAGKASVSLEEASEATLYSNRAVELKQLSNAAKSRHNRVHTSQRVREGIRHRMAVKTGVSAAERIQKRGIELIEGVENE